MSENSQSLFTASLPALPWQIIPQVSGVAEEIPNIRAQTPSGPRLVVHDSVGKELHNNRVRRPLAMDLAEEIRGMYRLLGLVCESGSNGCGNEHSQDALFTC